MRIDLSGIESSTNIPYQELYQEECKGLVLFGGAGSGKSIFAAQKTLLRLMTEPDHNYLVIRKVKATIRNSIFASIEAMIDDWGVSSFFKTNKTLLTITFLPNKSKIIFTGIDDPAKIKSIHTITSMLIEEADELTLNDFTQLRLRLRGVTKHYKQLMLCFNPVSKNHWLKKMFFDGEVDGFKVTHTTYLDNRFLDKDYIDYLKSLKETNPEYYTVYCLGQWGQMEGAVYKEYELIDEMPLDCEIYKVGVDFGFTHPSAVILVGIRGSDLFLEELIYESGLTNGELISKIKDCDSEISLRDCRFYPDHAEPDRILEMKRAGIICKSINKDINHGIEKVKSYGMHVVKGSVGLEKELELYEWDEKKDKPYDRDNHALDGMRYAVYDGTSIKSKAKRTGRIEL